MTLLSMVQGALQEIGDFEIPSGVADSQNQTSIQMIALANREGRDLSRRHAWSALTTEFTFELQNGLSAYAFTNVGLDDLLYAIKRSWWERGHARRVGGPVSPVGWQGLKGAGSVAVQGDRRWFRIQGNAIHVYPTPSGLTGTGNDVVFEYVSKRWCADAAGSPKFALSADDDVPLLDEDLIQTGLVWRFLKAKGLPYAEERDSYERAVTDAIGRDSSGEVLHFDDGFPVGGAFGTPDGGYGL